MQYDLKSKDFTAIEHLWNLQGRMFIRLNILKISRWISASSLSLIDEICPRYLKLLTYCEVSPFAQNSGKLDIITLGQSLGVKTIETELSALSAIFIIPLCCTTLSNTCCNPRHDGLCKHVFCD